MKDNIFVPFTTKNHPTLTNFFKQLEYNFNQDSGRTPNSGSFKFLKDNLALSPPPDIGTLREADWGPMTKKIEES